MEAVSFKEAITSGFSAPNTLIDVQIDKDGAITISPDSADQVGDHVVSVYLQDIYGINVKDVITFTVQVTSLIEDSIDQESPNALPDLCQDQSSLYLEEKENEQAADLPDEAIEITVGQNTAQVGVPSIAIASLTSIEDVDTLCAPVDYTLIVEDENGDILPD